MENTKPLYYDDLMKEWAIGGSFANGEVVTHEAIAAKVALLVNSSLTLQEQGMFILGFVECAKLIDSSFEAP